MRIIISPAKKMNVNTDTLSPAGVPRYIGEADAIREWMQG